LGFRQVFAVRVGTPYHEVILSERGLEVFRMPSEEDLVAVETVRSADQCAIGEISRDIAPENYKVSFQNKIWA
jgi:hypothetical protein